MRNFYSAVNKIEKKINTKVCSIVPLTNGKLQFTYLTDNNLITWDEEDYSEEDLPTLKIRCDIQGMIIIDYIDLKILAHSLNQSRIWNLK